MKFAMMETLWVMMDVSNVNINVKLNVLIVKMENVLNAKIPFTYPSLKEDVHL